MQSCPVPAAGRLMRTFLQTDTSEKPDFASGRGPACFFSIVAGEMERVRTLMAQELSGCSGPAGPLLSFLHFDSGKMIRPGLLLLSGRACGKIVEQHIRVGAIIELIHNATLLHDDVIDQGTRRRGFTTVNTLRGNKPAVLLGDLVLSRVFEMCAGLQQPVMTAIASAAARTCEGELTQTLEKPDTEPTESAYIKIISDKSGELFSVAAFLGAMLAGAGRQKSEAFAEFGRNIGIAFQITDDILDITGDETRMGKTAGSDIDGNKPTLPLIHLLRTADKATRDSVKELLQPDNGHSRPGPAAMDRRMYLLEKLEEFGSLSYSRSRAGRHVQRAVEALRQVADNDAGAALIKLAGFIVRRTN